MTDSPEIPYLLRAAKGEILPRPPVWMMRQAGRYMQIYRELRDKYPSFRERSENADLAIEISLQPWRAFQPDGVIMFSDILTPLAGIGIPFDIISEDDEATAATKDEVSPGFLEDTDGLPMVEQQLKSNSAVTNSTIITPKKKLMIMKRGTSKHNVTTPNSKENPPKSKQHRNLRGKNLSDKEKANAEARARIFNDSMIEQLQQQQLISNDDHAYLSHSNSTNTLQEEEQTTAIP